MANIYITTRHSMRSDSIRNVKRKVVNNKIKLDGKVYEVLPATFNNIVVKGEYNLIINY